MGSAKWGRGAAPSSYKASSEGAAQNGGGSKGKTLFLDSQHSDTKRVGFPHQAIFQFSVVTNWMSYNLILTLTARVSTDLPG